MKISSRQPAESLNFVFYGERPCLDFANTLRRRKDPLHPTVDLLDSTANLTNWISASRTRASWAKSLPDFQKVAAEIPISSIQELREAIILLAEHRLNDADCISPKSLESAINTLNRWSKLTPQHFLSIDDCFEGFLLRPTLTPEQVLGFVAQDAAMFFGSKDVKRLKKCSHERCGILFEDRSNGMKRQWCSMKECGNRMKARRHTQKEAAPPASQ
ncbi:CGNR zinc finger domain-containing protein [Corynebacterium lactis]|uniref:CGNR zinc finger domain-containing protein n=1 Tax=Corynebacterium lactis TaxID=1231000 RepID=UPI0009E8EBE1|nr:CGNR zinc finger domain-containing protein [Corynebacterium lactis]